MTDTVDSLAARRKELERRLAGLAPEQRASVERSWSADAEASPNTERPRTIPPRPADATAPMSFAQEMLWLLERTNPGHAYNVPRAVRVSGPLDVDALRQAIDALVVRHEALRTTFALVDGQPRQTVHAPVPVEMVRVDLRHLPPEQREAAATRSLLSLARESFDLESRPPFRAALIALDERDHVIVLVSHHVISDGWSGNIMLRELAALYDGLRVGAPVALSPLPVQFADFATWQRHDLVGEKLDGLVAYWREQLAGASTTLDLPTDRLRPAVAGFEGDIRSATMAPAVLEQVRAFARESGATGFMVYLAALYLLLARYSGEDEIVVGTPVAGRMLPELDGVVGFFTNTLLLRGSVAGAPTFRQLVARVRATVLGGYEHQDVPLEALIGARRPDGQPLVTAPRVSFLTEDPERVAFSLPGTESTPFGAARGATKFDLTIRVAERADGVRLSGEYRVDLFDGETVERMLEHYETLLTAAMHTPDRSVSDLDIMTPGERERLLVEWTSTGQPYQSEETLLDLLEAQERRSPDTIAVMDEQGALTYRDLHSRASLLARWLRSQGVQPGVLVAVCLERSLDLVVALLAVLKAGGAYVPLDPEYPSNRLAFMLEDSGAPVLLTQQHLAESLALRAGVTLLVDSDWDRVSSTPAAAIGPRVLASDPAYMIYTSGSTGEPKGAINSHRGITNRLRWMQDQYRLTSADTVLQKTPASFDVSVWEFFWPLMAGARLMLARPGGHRDPDYLLRVIEERQITLLHFVPSMLTAFLDVASLPASGTSLRDVICSGEALPTELARRFFAALPVARLHNLYGPTEAAVDVSYHQCVPDDERATVPIGRPVANTRLYVLDSRQMPVPVGLPGELYIGGVQVGLGYHRRPALTTERFVRDPFVADSGARLYRTGDRVRWLASGELEFLGRLDFQVKLRGQRIELGEIEAALLRQPGVSSAVALVREDLPGDQRVVAYVVPIGTPAPTTERLRTELQAVLPDVMVPSAIVTLDRLPLTPSGKIDRLALPAPLRQTRDLKPGYVAPWAPLEQEIAGIWAALLGLEQVGMNDDFFELGGNSLLAMRMFTEIERVWGRRLPLRSFFERPTVAEVVSVLLSAVEDEEESGVAMLQRDGPGTPLAFVHGDVLGHGWYCRRLAPLLGTSPMIVFPTLGPASPGAPATIEAMARSHVDTLRTIQPRGPYRLGGYCAGGLIAYEMARLLAAEGEQIESVVLVDAFCSNLRFHAIAPLVRWGAGFGSPEKRLTRRAQLFFWLHYYPARLDRVRRMGKAERRERVIGLMRRMLRRGVVLARPRPPGAASEPGLGPVGHFVGRAQRGYVPGRYDGRVALIWAASAIRGRRPWPTFGWERVARNLSPSTVAGTHVGIVMPQGIGLLAQQVKAFLSGAARS